MKCYGLVGRTLAHSFSKEYFTNKFIAEGITDCSYENFELQRIEEFSSLLMAHPGLKGLNVTIPYKEEVLRFLTAKNEIVKETGACNCIKIIGDNLTGYNTDVTGFHRSLAPQLKPHHKKALILGTGGASKAVRYVLNELGIEYSLVSRRKKTNELEYEDIDADIMAEYHLIINTTPLGMYPAIDAAPPIPYQFINAQYFLFDIIYNPVKTKFLAEGEKRGAQICNGYEMLINQAEDSWRIWNNEN